MPIPLVATLKSSLRETSPKTYKALQNAYQSVQISTSGETRRQEQELSQTTTDDEVFEFARRHIWPYQIKSEFLSLIGFLRETKPVNYLEVGTANGGSHFLVRRLCATIQKSIGIDMDVRNRFLIDRLTATRNSHYIDGDSTSAQTIRTVDSLINTGENNSGKLDVLFLDGDHSYEGIAKDFELYKGYVRPGGIIIFHDIVADHGQRFGTKTQKYTGGVPQFFAEIKQDYEHKEFIEDPDQDGFGIGVIVTP